MNLSTQIGPDTLAVRDGGRRISRTIQYFLWGVLWGDGYNKQSITYLIVKVQSVTQFQDSPFFPPSLLIGDCPERSWTTLGTKDKSIACAQRHGPGTQLHQNYN